MLHMDRGHGLQMSYKMVTEMKCMASQQGKFRKGTGTGYLGFWFFFYCKERIIGLVPYFSC